MKAETPTVWPGVVANTPTKAANATSAPLRPGDRPTGRASIASLELVINRPAFRVRAARSIPGPARSPRRPDVGRGRWRAIWRAAPAAIRGRPAQTATCASDGASVWAADGPRRPCGRGRRHDCAGTGYRPAGTEFSGRSADRRRDRRRRRLPRRAKGRPWVPREIAPPTRRTGGP